jgi:hypothetical protein
MATNDSDAGCPEDRTIRVYNYSFFALLTKSPNKTPVHFNQHHGLVLCVVLKAAILVHLVTKQAYERINLVGRRAYEEHFSMKSFGFNFFGKGCVQCNGNICQLELNHSKTKQLQRTGL